MSWLAFTCWNQWSRVGILGRDSLFLLHYDNGIGFIARFFLFSFSSTNSNFSRLFLFFIVLTVILFLRFFFLLFSLYTLGPWGLGFSNYLLSNSVPSLRFHYLLQVLGIFGQVSMFQILVNYLFIIALILRK